MVANQDRGAAMSYNLLVSIEQKSWRRAHPWVGRALLLALLLAGALVGIILGWWRWPLTGIDSRLVHSIGDTARVVGPVLVLLLGAAVVDVTRRRGWFWSAAGVLGLAVVVLLIWRVPQELYDYVPDGDVKERAGAEATTRTGIFAGLAGVAALVGLTFTARTYRVTQRGHLTDRYTKAIDQLGSKELDVRLGGIYALEQLAHDSDRDMDRKTIVEVLSAFVRERSNPIYRWRHHLEWLGQEKTRLPTAEKRNAEEHVRIYPLPNDVQAAVTVLGRLPSATDADLSGAYLRKVTLESEDRLIRALLHPVRDDKADLSEAKLVKVDLTKANLHEANLTEARLMRATLTKAWLAGADLTGAHLTGADLSGAMLVGYFADGIWYPLAEWNNLVKKDPKVTYNKVARANFSKADLTDVKGLDPSEINEACGDTLTVLPKNLDRPKKWKTEPTPDRFPTRR